MTDNGSIAFSWLVPNIQRLPDAAVVELNVLYLIGVDPESWPGVRQGVLPRMISTNQVFER